MTDEYRRKFPVDEDDKKKHRGTTGCRYCAVGCGYNAFLVPEGLTGESFYDGVSRFITPAMTNIVKFHGRPNKAAVASLGLLLGTYSEPGRLVGRVGGYRKGWAAAKIDLTETFDNHRGTAGCANEDYPYRNSEDRYSNAHLRKTFGQHTNIKVNHNLDNHAFGPEPGSAHADQSGVPRGYARLMNQLVSKKSPDVRLLWMIGGNYLGQTNDSQRKRRVLIRRLRAGGGGRGEIKRPRRATVCEEEVAQSLTELEELVHKSEEVLRLKFGELVPDYRLESCLRGLANSFTDLKEQEAVKEESWH